MIKKIGSNKTHIMFFGGAKGKVGGILLGFVFGKHGTNKLVASSLAVQQTS